MPLKSAREGQMIDLNFVVAFFHKAKLTELTITHEINYMLVENTISYSTVGKHVRTFVLSTKETNTLVLPESEGDFSLDDCIPLMLSEEPFPSVRQIPKKLMTSKSTMY
jgi:uncharacterized protein YbaR (Trm112 family)